MVGLDGLNTNGFVVYTVSSSRIDAQVVNSVGDWSDSFSLVSDELLPPPPIIIEPGEATTINPPTFVWHPVLEAIGYEIQYGDGDPHFVTINTSLTNFTPPQPLLIKSYYWRVRAQLDGGGYSRWSPIRTVSIESIAYAAPSLNFYATALPTLTWNRVSWATQYEVQVDTVSTFTLPRSFLVPNNTLELSVDGLTDGLYYWRIRARHRNGTWGFWTQVHQFVVDVP
jgi:hypothetical protein